MRRTRRGRLLNLGIILLAYSAIHVYSAAVRNASDGAESPPATEAGANDNTSPNPLFVSTEKTTEYDDGSASTSTTPRTLSSEAPQTFDDGKPKPRTYRVKRNCTPPAIDQFPPPLMGPRIRERGGLIIHILIAIFTFLGLATL